MNTTNKENVHSKISSIKNTKSSKIFNQIKKKSKKSIVKNKN